MAKINVKPTFDEKTHEGARAAHMTVKQALRRSVLSTLLWEDEFYEDGIAIADRIHELAGLVDLPTLAALAIEARQRFHLRHVSLWLLIALIKRGRGNSIVSATIAQVISRADELAELVALYWKDGKRPLSKQLKLGLAAAFRRFDAYQLAKYDRAEKVRLRDVLFLSHAKPKDAAQAALWKQLVANQLASPDTWEVALSGGADKAETFRRLIEQGDLGYLALLRNLRNMAQSGVDARLVGNAIRLRKGAGRVLPYRYFAAAKAAPQFEPDLDAAMVASFDDQPKLAGKTVIVLDVSGSMQGRMSAKSEMSRLDAGAALAAVIRGSCERAAVYATAGNDGLRKHKTELVAPRQGMALRDALVTAMGHLGGGGIFLKPMLDHVEAAEKTADRIVVITDEQDCAIADKDAPTLAAPFGTVGNYLINVSGHQNGVGYGPKWTHLDGLSEATVAFIYELEASRSAQ